MGFARVRVLAVAVLLALWIGWLAFQALTRGRGAPILSRSQLLIADLDAIAVLSEGDDGRPSPAITVKDVLWPAAFRDLKGRTAIVPNLTATSLRGYRGAGEYLVPLSVRVNLPTFAGQDLPSVLSFAGHLAPGQPTISLRVAPLPRSPGFDSLGPTPLFIYPVLPETLEQWQAIRGPRPVETSNPGG